jgi:hypothetical protein
VEYKAVFKEHVTSEKANKHKERNKPYAHVPTALQCWGTVTSLNRTGSPTWEMLTLPDTESKSQIKGLEVESLKSAEKWENIFIILDRDTFLSSTLSSKV